MTRDKEKREAIYALIFAVVMAGILVATYITTIGKRRSSKFDPLFDTTKAAIERNKELEELTKP